MADFFQSIADTISGGIQKATSGVGSFIKQTIQGTNPIQQKYAESQQPRKPSTQPIVTEQVSSSLTQPKKTVSVTKEKPVVKSSQSFVDNILKTAPPSLSGPIDSRTYDTNATPLNVNQSGVHDEFGGSVNTSTSLAKSIIDSITPIKDFYQKSNAELSEKLSAIPSSLRSDVMIQLQQSVISDEQRKLLDLEPGLVNLNNQISQLNVQEQEALANAGNRAGVSLEFMSGEQNRITRIYAAKKAGISAELSAKTAIASIYQGNIDNAIKSIDTAAKLLTFDITQQKSDLQFFIERNDAQIATLDKSVQTSISRVFDDLVTREQNSRDDYKLKLTFAANNGLSNLTASDLKTKSVDEIAAMAAKQAAKDIALNRASQQSLIAEREATAEARQTLEDPSIIANASLQTANDGSQFYDISKLSGNSQIKASNAIRVLYPGAKIALTAAQSKSLSNIPWYQQPLFGIGNLFGGEDGNQQQQIDPSTINLSTK